MTNTRKTIGRQISVMIRILFAHVHLLQVMINLTTLAKKQ